MKEVDSANTDESHVKKYGNQPMEDKSKMNEKNCSWVEIKQNKETLSWKEMQKQNDLATVINRKNVFLRQEMQQTAKEWQKT